MRTLRASIIMTRPKNIRDFPPNDELLHVVLGVLRGYPDTIDQATVVREVGESIGVGSYDEPWRAHRVLEGGVTYCLEILQRESLAQRTTRRWVRRGRWVATHAGRTATQQVIDAAWAHELERPDPNMDGTNSE